METIKLLHVSCAYMTGASLLLRGIWAVLESSLINQRRVKVIPHIIDSVLLVSGIVMAVSWQLSPLQHSWLAIKLLALLVYIALGLILLRFANTPRSQIAALFGAMIVYGFIVAMAHQKSMAIVFQSLLG